MLVRRVLAVTLAAATVVALSSTAAAAAEPLQAATSVTQHVATAAVKLAKTPPAGACYAGNVCVWKDANYQNYIHAYYYCGGVYIGNTSWSAGGSDWMTYSISSLQNNKTDGSWARFDDGNGNLYYLPQSSPGWRDNLTLDHDNIPWYGPSNWNDEIINVTPC
jgi:hypothetical protein